MVTSVTSPAPLETSVPPVFTMVSVSLGGTGSSVTVLTPTTLVQHVPEVSHESEA